MLLSAFDRSREDSFMFSFLTHPRNFVTAMALIVGGITYGSVVAQQSAGSRATEEGVKPKVKRGHAPTIGPYHLNMNTGDASKLVELTPDEKKALNPVVEFKGERIYNAPPANFAGTNWKIVLGAVDNRVYKVSALVVLDNRERRDTMWRNLNDLLRTSLGSPASAEANIVLWDTEDGNVVT
jgi:hypothetical protein